MDQNEVVLRAIGILTESQNMFATLNKDEDADYEINGAIGELFNEILPTFSIPAGATAHEAAEAAGTAALTATARMVSAFTFLFSELADVHDAGRDDIKTADLLQELALRFSNPPTQD